MSAGMKLPYPINLKAHNIEAALKDKVGMIIWGNDCVSVMFKKKNLSMVNIETEPGCNVYVWLISGSTEDASDFEHEFGQLQSIIRNMLSIRDVSFRLVRDFISEYLSAKFYDRRFNKPVALEFVVAEVTNNSMVFSAIGYDGSIREEGPKGISIIGCTGQEERIKFAEMIEASGATHKGTFQEIFQAVEDTFPELQGENSVGAGWKVVRKSDGDDIAESETEGDAK